MRKENLVRYVLRLTLTLLIITGVVATTLAGVNAIAADDITANQAEKTQKALTAVLPNTHGLQQLPLQGEADIVQEVYTAGGNYAVKVAPGGFNGAITMMVGIVDGAVAGISVLSHTETPGLGAVAAAQNAKGEAFRDQFTGRSGELSVGDQIDALSGATITSDAVVTGVNAALGYVANLH